MEDLDLDSEEEEELDKMKSKAKSKRESVGKKKGKEKEEVDPMSEYERKELEILQWCKQHPDEQWTDAEFPANNRQFYRDELNAPAWVSELKNIEWKRPQ